MAFPLSSYIETYKSILSQYDHVKVRLIDYTRSPYNLAIASARTCYSSRGILLPEDMDKNPELRDKIAESTMQAGHLTTRQHAQFIFGLEGVSRHVLWQFLHAHPYYNSEQVSQRYVPIGRGDWYGLPVSLRRNEVFSFHEETLATYHKLIEILKEPIEEEFFAIYRSRKNNPEKYTSHIHKKAMEIARYVMPLSTTAYLYHTISVLTLYRYVHMMLYYRNDEIIVLVLRMLQEIQKVDPLLVQEIPKPADYCFEQSHLDEAKSANNEFDQKLNLEKIRSRLVSASENPERILHDVWQAAVPSIKAGGQSAGKENFLDQILNTELNVALSDTLYPVTLDPKSRILNHLHFTFQKKLSHTADSQEQRHRTLPGARPVLSTRVSLEIDYITPSMIDLVKEAREIYEIQMEKNFTLVRNLYHKGLSTNDLCYILPNAFPVRFYESGDFLNFFHKWKSRLCYTSQEEIFYSTLDEVRQLTSKFPIFEKYIGAPCALRQRTKPVCPEGDKYCGVKVWKLTLDEYTRKI